MGRDVRQSPRMSVLANGFAAAVQPVQVQTVIATDAQGLEAGEVSIPVHDGAIAAYRARPAGATRLPTIVLVHEIWSVHEYFRDLCRRLAKAGYLAVAPDLYGRQGDVSEADIVELNIPTGIPLVYELDESLKPLRKYYLGDAEAAARKAQAVANQGKVATS